MLRNKLRNFMSTFFADKESYKEITTPARAVANS